MPSSRFVAVALWWIFESKFVRDLIEVASLILGGRVMPEQLKTVLISAALSAATAFLTYLLDNSAQLGWMAPLVAIVVTPILDLIQKNLRGKVGK